VVKSNVNSRFVLWTLEEIRDTKDVVLQVIDTDTNFTGGKKCFLCEVVSFFEYNRQPHLEDLLRENIVLIQEVGRLRNKIDKLKNKIKRLEK
jgi:hypothetical protein